MARYYCDSFHKEIIKLGSDETSPNGEQVYHSWKKCYESEASKPDYNNTHFEQWKNKEFKKKGKKSNASNN